MGIWMYIWSYNLVYIAFDFLVVVDNFGVVDNFK